VHPVSTAGRADPFGQSLGFGEPLASPDGRKVLLARRNLTVATFATGAVKRIGAGEETTASWSPDSKRLAYSGPQGSGLYVVDLQGGRKRALSTPRSDVLPFAVVFTSAWSPDGKWIAFSCQVDYDTTEVFVVHPDGSGLRWLTDYAPDGSLAWSRGDRLAFIGRRGSENVAHLVVLRPPGRHVDILGPPLGGGAAVAWAPDGQRIAYAATNGSSNVSAIYTVRADGSDRRRLTPSSPPASEEAPLWWPDGKKMLFVRTRVGGGAIYGVEEVWMMRADGSHRHALTTPYPDGGDSVEPAWVVGPAHTEPVPRAREVRVGRTTVLRVPFAVDGISAEGARAAIAPVAYGMQRDTEPTPPILLWRPGGGEIAQLLASPCGGIQELVLSRDRLAFDCDNQFFDQTEQAVWVYDLRTRIPREVFFGQGGVSANDVRGIYVDNIGGGGGLLAFGSERVNARGFALHRTLWRVDGLDAIALRTGAQTANLVAARGGRLAAELADGRVAILRPTGAVLRILSVGHRRSPQAPPLGGNAQPAFLLTDHDLLSVDHGILRAYDVRTGSLHWERRVPASAHLEAADGRLVVYAAGSSLHIVSPAGERVIQTRARWPSRIRFLVQHRLHAALTANGLYYCFNVVDAREPGRVVFVPRSALSR
jgi:WD40-like Beta Propeller Repeat